MFDRASEQEHEQSHEQSPAIERLTDELLRARAEVAALRHECSELRVIATSTIRNTSEDTGTPRGGTRADEPPKPVLWGEEGSRSGSPSKPGASQASSDSVWAEVDSMSGDDARNALKVCISYPHSHEFRASLTTMTVRSAFFHFYLFPLLLFIASHNLHVHSSTNFPLHPRAARFPRRRSRTIYLQCLQYPITILTAPQLACLTRHHSFRLNEP